MDIISRSRARSQGHQTYYTGNLCKHGHDSERSTASAKCVQCQRNAKKRYYRDDKEKALQRSSKWYRENKQRQHENNKAWRARNPKAAKEHLRCSYQKNKATHQAYQQQYNRTNKHAIQAQRRQYYLEHKDTIRARQQEHHKENKFLYNMYSSQRRARKLSATPTWLSDEHYQQILALYQQRQVLSEQLGVNFEVDHVVPLQYPLVCGLHVPWNLQLLTLEENRQKSNSFPVEAPEYESDHTL